MTKAEMKLLAAILADVRDTLVAAGGSDDVILKVVHVMDELERDAVEDRPWLKKAPAGAVNLRWRIRKDGKWECQEVDE